MKRTKEEAEQTRQALLDAAMTVFHQRGVARASLDQIARAAGLTRGALYWHFKNKEHLFEALCERHLAVMHEEMHHMLEDDSPQAWDTLVAGGVIIGDIPSFRVDNMPYGGVKSSCFGREGVRYAIEDMTEPRLMVLRDRPR